MKCDKEKGLHGTSLFVIRYISPYVQFKHTPQPPPLPPAPYHHTTNIHSYNTTYSMRLGYTQGILLLYKKSVQGLTDHRIHF